jgi:hypothetical protein
MTPFCRMQLIALLLCVAHAAIPVASPPKYENAITRKLSVTLQGDSQFHIHDVTPGGDLELTLSDYLTSARMLFCASTKR